MAGPAHFASETEEAGRRKLFRSAHCTSAVQPNLPPAPAASPGFATTRPPLCAARPHTGFASCTPQPVWRLTVCTGQWDGPSSLSGQCRRGLLFRLYQQRGGGTGGQQVQPRLWPCLANTSAHINRPAALGKENAGAAPQGACWLRAHHCLAIPDGRCAIAGAANGRPALPLRQGVLAGWLRGTHWCMPPCAPSICPTMPVTCRPVW